MSRIIAVRWLKEPVCTVLPQEEDDRLQLVESWPVLMEVAGHRPVAYVIPAGFRFEGSVPRLFWRLITPADPAAWAAFCLHDWLYILVKIGVFTRADADECLRLALRQNGFGWLTVSAVYSGVRAFGWRYAGADLTDTERRELLSAGSAVDWSRPAISVDRND